MTRRANAAVAGSAFLVYIAAALLGMLLANRGMHGEGTAAKLARIAEHVADIRLAFVLQLIGCICAFVLAVTLHALTRDEDPDIAMLGLLFRAAEGVLGVIAISSLVGLLRIATAPAPTDAAVNEAFATFLMRMPIGAPGALLFALGSTMFSYLLLRGRIIPVALGWIGVAASVLLVFALPMDLLGLTNASVRNVMWLPMLVFEVTLAFWFLIKGAATANRMSPR